MSDKQVIKEINVCKQTITKARQSADSINTHYFVITYKCDLTINIPLGFPAHSILTGTSRN